MTSHLQSMINYKSVYIYSRFTYPCNGATSEAAFGAFSPQHQESGAVVISRHHTKNISLKATLGRCWLTLLLLMPYPNLLCLPWLHWMWGTVFHPYPCGSLVKSGEAAEASTTGWKLDGSWMEALMPYKHQLPAAQEGWWSDSSGRNHFQAQSTSPSTRRV